MSFRPKFGHAAGTFRLKYGILILCTIAVLFCYFVFIDFNSTNSSALSGEIKLGESFVAEQKQGNAFLVFLFEYFGSFVYFMPLMALYAVYSFLFKFVSFRDTDFFALGSRTLGAFWIIIGATATLSDLFAKGPTGAGGILGDFLNIFFASIVSSSLSAIVALLFLFAGIFLFIARSPIFVCEFLGGKIMSLINRRDESTVSFKREETAPQESEMDVLNRIEEQEFNSTDIIKEDLREPKFSENNTLNRQEPQFGDSFNSSANVENNVENNYVPNDNYEEKSPIYEEFTNSVSQNQNSYQEELPIENEQNYNVKAQERYQQEIVQNNVEEDSGYTKEGYVKPNNKYRDYKSPYSTIDDPAVREAHEAIFGKDNGLKQDSFDNNTPSSYITIDKDNSEKTSYTENINDIPSTVIIRDSQPRVNKDNNYASYEIHDKYPEEEVKTIISRNPYQERPQTPQNIQEQKEEPSTYITRNYNNDRNEVKKVEDDAPATIIVRGDPIVNVSSTASSENIDDKSIEVKEDHSQSQESTTNVNPGVISFDDLRRKSEASFEVQKIQSSAFIPTSNVVTPANNHHVATADTTNALQNNIKKPISEKDLNYVYQNASRGVSAEKPTETHINYEALKTPQSYTYVNNGIQVTPTVNNEYQQVETKSNYYNENVSNTVRDNTYQYSSPSLDRQNTEINVNQNEVKASYEEENYAQDRNSRPQMQDNRGSFVSYPQETVQTPEVQEDRDFSVNHNNEDAEINHSQSGISFGDVQELDGGLGRVIHIKREEAKPQVKPLDYQALMAQEQGVAIPRKKGQIDILQSVPNKIFTPWRPSLDLLTPSNDTFAEDEGTIQRVTETIDKVMKDYNIKAKVVRVLQGPVVTRYDLDPEPGVSSNSIIKVAKDLSRYLQVPSVNIIDIVPNSTYVGVEVPNKHRCLRTLYDIASQKSFIDAKMELPICLGCSVSGAPVVVDLVKAPHLLVAGTTGSGKSAGLNSIIVSLLLKKSPSELRLVLIDPKFVEFSCYRDLPHLLTPVITDIRKDAALALKWCVDEMERRYKLLQSMQVRKLSEYNELIDAANAEQRVIYDPFWNKDSGEEPRPLRKLPSILIVIEEYADLAAQTQGRKKNSDNNPVDLINRLAAKARAAGMHIILATQTPRADILSSVIKNNMPSRIAFRVNSSIDSRVILDDVNGGGAENLLGNGDMLCKYTEVYQGFAFRVHGAFTSNSDIQNVVEAWKRCAGAPEYVDSVCKEEPEEVAPPELQIEEEIFDRAVAYTNDFFAKHQKYPSTSSYQANLRLGWAKAVRLVEILRRAHVIEDN